MALEQSHSEERRRQKQESQRIVNEAQGIIDQLYPVVDTIDSLMRTQYLRIYWVTEGLRELRGKKILDLGCGARAVPAKLGEEEHRHTHYEPWFARFASACGAEVTGIDRRPSPNEIYDHQEADITKPGTLQFLNGSFDIVNSSGLLIGPHRLQDASGLNVTAPELLETMGDSELKKLDDHITQEVTRILREGGYFLYNESVFQKQQGKLQPVERLALMLEQGIPMSPKR